MVIFAGKIPGHLVSINLVFMWTTSHVSMYCWHLAVKDYFFIYKVDFYFIHLIIKLFMLKQYIKKYLYLLVFDVSIASSCVDLVFIICTFF